MRLYGVDLCEYWNERRFRKLLNLLNHLPRNSVFQEALAQDDELAEMLYDDDEDEAPHLGPRIFNFSPEVEAIFNLIDKVGENTMATVAAAGGKPRRNQPMKRPSTAWTRAGKNKRRREHESLVARVLPNR